MVNFLECFELAQLLRQDRNVVPDNVDVGMAIYLFFLYLLGKCNLILPRLFCLLLSRRFLSSLCRRRRIIRRFLLFRSDHFPLHLEGTLPHQLVLRICQVNSNLSTVENVVVAIESALGRACHLGLRLCRLLLTI